MQVDYFIIGQGICGTMLSWFLQKEGKSFLVIDDDNEHSASRAAAGIINPVTGRRYVYSWMIDTVMPFAVDTYTAMGQQLQTTLVRTKSIIDFFPSPQMRDAFVTRITEDDTFLHSYPDQNHFNQYFHHEFGCGEIRPAYMVDLAGLLAAWRGQLKNAGLLLEAPFDPAELKTETEGVTYQRHSAQRIVFCDGVAATGNPWFQLLPFSPNKGEALIIEAEGLTNEHIFKKGMVLAPLAQKNRFWVGSNYQWAFDNDGPSRQFYQQANHLLQQWLKVPYRILEHKAAIRPATLERRPFVGFHPRLPAVGILNGMGTKGSSLAPFFAHQLVQHLVYDFPIAEEADVKRFTRILSK